MNNYEYESYFLYFKASLKFCLLSEIELVSNPQICFLVTGSIKTNRKLDRELIDEYHLEVEAEDDVHTSYTRVLLTVLDVNDCAPKFTKLAYSFDIPEDTPSSTIVGRVFAEDNDLGASGKVTYSFHSDWGQDVFQFNPIHGTFMLLKAVDFEIVS